MKNNEQKRNIISFIGEDEAGNPYIKDILIMCKESVTDEQRSLIGEWLLRNEEEFEVGDVGVKN